MNTKKIISIIIVLILLIVAIGVGYFYWYFPKKTAVVNNQQVTALQDVTINDNTNPFVIKITYPQIAGQNDFNQKAKAIVDKEIADFKTNSLANDAAVKATDPSDYAKYPRTYELDIGYAKGELDNNISSVIFNVYNFEGGAHGASYFVPLNYDVKNKKEITLADLFPDQPNYLQKISDYCVTDLTKQITIRLGGTTDGSWIQDGAGPVAENFKFFLINSDNTITFYFPQYQVAFGAAGDFKVIFPR